MDQNFLDPQISNEGDAYGPRRFKEIVKECWYISDNIHTSYNEVLDLSFQERLYIIECINEKLKATKEAIDQSKQKLKNNS